MTRTVADLLAFLQQWPAETPMDATVRGNVMDWLRGPFEATEHAIAVAIDDDRWSDAEAGIRELERTAGESDPQVTYWGSGGRGNGAPHALEKAPRRCLRSATWGTLLALMRTDR